MDDYPGELVIIDLNDECAYDTDNRVNIGRLQGYQRLTKEQFGPIWTKFRDNIRKPCKGFGGRFLPDVTMNEFIGDGKGCVMTVSRNVVGAEEDATKGFYLYKDMQQFNHYADTDNYRTMAEDQISKMKMNRVLKADSDQTHIDPFFILSWTMTLKGTDALTSLWIRAASAQSSLFWYAYREFTPYSFPNVLMVDFFGQPYLLDDNLSQEEYRKASKGDITALAMAVNLQLASQNCNIPGGRI
jgi:hypothetical protein